VAQLYSSLKHDHDLGRKFLDVVTSREGVEKLGGMSETSAEGTTHSVLIEEQVAFANWINMYVNMMRCSTVVNQSGLVKVTAAMYASNIRLNRSQRDRDKLCLSETRVVQRGKFNNKNYFCANVCSLIS